MVISPTENLRRIPRQPGNTVGPLRLTFASAPSFWADVHDISILGVCLIADIEFQAGSTFRVEAGPRDRILQDALWAELRHVTQRADGRWLLGCNFSRYLTFVDLETLG